ncbi:MAG: hypothetical protein P4N59_18065 [Negativicutes bacterium]|nr:hypothetical protein [Negativicutes bacterium]
MSIFKVYIGDLDDPEFLWDQSRRASQINPAPRPLSPAMPLTDGYLAFSLVCKIGSGEFEGRQVTSGCWVAKVTRAQIVSFIYEYYIWWQLYHQTDPDGPTPLDECADILNCVKNFDAGKYYAFVASETLGLPPSSIRAKDLGQKARLAREWSRQHHPA